MSELKRLEVKYIRDGAKALYEKDTECYICSSSDELQMHHYYSLTLLWENWKRKNNITIRDSDHIMSIRDTFVAEHHSQMYENVVTLCKFHHMDRLHKIYGKVPLLITAKKQERWVAIQREKEYKE